MMNSASTSTTTPGSTVSYTVTVTNTGQVENFDTTFTMPLSDVLDDATYDNDAAASSGVVSFTSPNLSWDGDLSPGQSATITFSVMVNNPDTGNKTLADTLTSTTPGANCPASGTAPAACSTSVTVLIPALTITQAANISSTTPGSTVDYTITVADTGQTPYSGITVTVSNPDTGNKILANTVTSTAAGSTCPAGTSASQCTASVDILSGSLSITTPASADLGATTPGGSVANGLGDAEVTDNRGFGANWTATVSSTDFTTGGGSPAETIPASDATYAISGLTTTGTATYTHITTVGLSGNPQAVVSAANVAGNTTVTWNPTVQVTAPGGAIAGTYTATITHSVA